MAIYVCIHVPTRQVFETPGSKDVADLLVLEGLAVARAEGVAIPEEEADHILKKVVLILVEVVMVVVLVVAGDRQPPGEQELHVCRRPEETPVRGGLYQRSRGGAGGEAQHQHAGQQGHGLLRQGAREQVLEQLAGTSQGVREQLAGTASQNCTWDSI